VTAAVGVERVVMRAPLGLRFWDLAAGVPFLGALEVDVRSELPSGRLGRPRRASLTRSGVHVVHDRAPAQTEEPDAGPDIGPDATPERFCRVDVGDPEARFQPLRLRAGLPTWQLAAVECGPASTPLPLPVDLVPGPFVPLFPSPARPVPAARVVVRAELRTEPRPDDPAGRPIRWALVAVRPEGGPTAFGLSGVDGQVAVVLPWPEPPAADLGSPAAAELPLIRQFWGLELTVHSDEELAAAQEPPDLCAVLDQLPAALPGLAAPVLRYGRETVVRSPDRSTVTVVPNA
jgi:hypothetical protein